MRLTLSSTALLLARLSLQLGSHSVITFPGDRPFDAAFASNTQFFLDFAAASGVLGVGKIAARDWSPVCIYNLASSDDYFYWPIALRWINGFVYAIRNGDWAGLRPNAASDYDSGQREAKALLHSEYLLE
jgi:hypothetical protein